MSTIRGLVATAIGVMMLIVAFVIIPVVGSSVEESVHIDAASQWNHSVNSDIPTGYDTWTALAGLIKVAAIIVIIGGLFDTFRSIKA